MVVFSAEDQTAELRKEPLGRGYKNQWKKRRPPNANTLKKIAKNQAFGLIINPG
jgi:hypothetical protein